MVLAPTESGFQLLADYEQATDEWFGMDQCKRDTLLSEIKTILERFDLQDHVGIDLKHKHFNMPAGHVLVEQCKHDCSIMQPKPLPSDGEAHGLTPFSFILDGIRWLPYEFVECSNQAIEGLQKVEEAGHEFLGELAAVLLRNRLEQVLGFHIFHREHLLGAPHGTVETPGSVPNQLLIRPYSADLKAELRQQAEFHEHPVMWMWPTAYKGAPITHHCGICFRCTHCGSHCNGHKCNQQ